ncbi:unnamed protein product, partial [Heterosigma akashiwo]
SLAWDVDGFCWENMEAFAEALDGLIQQQKERKVREVDRETVFLDFLWELAAFLSGAHADLLRKTARLARDARGQNPAQSATRGKTLINELYDYRNHTAGTSQTLRQAASFDSAAAAVSGGTGAQRSRSGTAVEDSSHALGRSPSGEPRREHQSAVRPHGQHLSDTSVDQLGASWQAGGMNTSPMRRQTQLQ